MEPIVSKSLPVSLNQHRSHGPIFNVCFLVANGSEDIQLLPNGKALISSERFHLLYLRSSGIKRYMSSSHESGGHPE